MNRDGRIPVVALAAVFILSILVPMLSAGAGQSTVSTEVKKGVPDNPAEHAAPEQPIPYSHKKHLALGLPCATCHTNVEPGNLMSYPAITTCMSCHRSIGVKKPAIQKLASFAKSGQSIPWVRVYRVLPGVTWTHRKHLTAGIKCETCHGQVSEMETMSEATSVTTMAVCLKCHESHGAPTACKTCHMWP